MKWEYKRVELDIGEIASATFEAELDALGEEGWELVTSVQHTRHGYSHEVHFLFKRPVSVTLHRGTGGFRTPSLDDAPT